MRRTDLCVNVNFNSILVIAFTLLVVDCALWRLLSWAVNKHYLLPRTVHYFRTCLGRLFCWALN